MTAKGKKTLGIIGIVLLSVFALCVGLIVMLAAVIYISPAPEKDPDRRDVAVRMEEYYGEPFRVIDTKEPEDSDRITLWTLEDSHGVRCHAARGLDYDGGSMVWRTYDDYRVMQLMQIPAADQLLTQERFTVIPQNDLGQCTAFNADYPAYCWIVDVRNYNDLADALHLTLKAVSALPADEGEIVWRDAHWGSIAPKFCIGTSRYAEYQPGAEYDEASELYRIQERFCDECRRNGEEERLPQGTENQHPKSGTYTLKYHEDTLELPLLWDAEKRCFILQEREDPDEKDYPVVPNLLSLLDVCGFDVRRTKDAFTYEYETHYQGDVIYIRRSFTTHDTAVDGTRGWFTSDHSYIELNENQIEQLFGITFEIDPQTMTGKILFDENDIW